MFVDGMIHDYTPWLQYGIQRITLRFIDYSRRGIPPGALLSFVGQLGVTPSLTTIDIGKFETIIRTYMDNIVPRLMMILDPIYLILDNFPDQEIALPYKKGRPFLRKTYRPIYKSNLH